MFLISENNSKEEDEGKKKREERERKRRGVPCSWSYESNNRSKRFGEGLLHAIFWNIWKERNNRVFLSKHKEANEVIEANIRDMGNWLLVILDFKGLSLSDFTRDWWTSINCYIYTPNIRRNTPNIQRSLNWCPPPAGAWKLNFDGALKGNPGLAGFGCVIRDHNSVISKILSGPLEPCNSAKAETVAMLLGLRELKTNGFVRVHH